MNNITIVGRLTRDPEYVDKKGDKSQYAKFTVAVDNEYGDLTSFFDCIVFGNTADNVDKYLSKGRQVAVRGRHEQGEPYTDKNGIKRKPWTLRVERVEFLGSKKDSGDVKHYDSWEELEADNPFQP